MSEKVEARKASSTPGDEPCEARPQGEGLSPSQLLLEFGTLANSIFFLVPQDLQDYRRLFMGWEQAFNNAYKILETPATLHYGITVEVAIDSRGELELSWITLSPVFRIRVSNDTYSVPLTLEAMRRAVTEAVPNMVLAFAADLKRLSSLISCHRMYELASKVRQLEERPAKRRQKPSSGG